MRILKFRAWDRDLKKMYKKWTVIPEDDRSHILMQFTGLEDKNCKEIYEGDIVIQDFDNCGSEASTKCIIEFYKGTFKGFSNVRNEYFHPCYFLNCKVIGNKFENPKLLDDYVLSESSEVKKNG